MIVSRHVWRTTDGRFVETGDPDAAFLAYAAGDEVGDLVAEKVGLAAYEKARGKPADKAKAKPADKAATGLTINRQK